MKGINNNLNVNNAYNQANNINDNDPDKPGVEFSLDQVKSLLNYNGGVKNDGFATSALKTNGTFRLSGGKGANRKLVNVNRFRLLPQSSNAGGSESLMIRQALLKAFEDDKADEGFLRVARGVLGLTEKGELDLNAHDNNGTIKGYTPLERRMVKLLISQHEALKGLRALDSDELDGGANAVNENDVVVGDKNAIEREMNESEAKGANEPIAEQMDLENNIVNRKENVNPDENVNPKQKALLDGLKNGLQELNKASWYDKFIKGVKDKTDYFFNNLGVNKAFSDDDLMGNLATHLGKLIYKALKSVQEENVDTFKNVVREQLEKFLAAAGMADRLDEILNYKEEELQDPVDPVRAEELKAKDEELKAVDTRTPYHEEIAECRDRILSELTADLEALLPKQLAKESLEKTRRDIRGAMRFIFNPTDDTMAMKVVQFLYNDLGKGSVCYDALPAEKRQEWLALLGKKEQSIVDEFYDKTIQEATLNREGIKILENKHQGIMANFEIEFQELAKKLGKDPDKNSRLLIAFSGLKATIGRDIQKFIIEVKAAPRNKYYDKLLSLDKSLKTFLAKQFGQRRITDDEFLSKWNKMIDDAVLDLADCFGRREELNKKIEEQNKKINDSSMN